MSLSIHNFSSLEKELESAKTDLKDLNENIKRIYGKQDNFGFVCGIFSPPTENRTFSLFRDKKRVPGSFDPTQKRNDSKKDRSFDAPFAKRRSDAFNNKIFSRLGVKEEQLQDDELDDFPRPKISSRVISKEQPTATRENALAMQSRNNDLARNKRMFGSLLGHIQKFRNEEDKGVQEKRAKIEMKIEKQQLLVKEKLKLEKDTLIADRRRKQLEIRSLEIKMFKMRNLKAWEEQKRTLTNFIGTKTKPQIFYLPKVMSPKSEGLLKESQLEVLRLIEDKRREVDEEIIAIGARLESDLLALQEGKLKKSQEIESETSDNNPFSDNENNESVKGAVKQEPDDTTNGKFLSFGSARWLISNLSPFQIANVSEASRRKKLSDLKSS